MDKLAILVLVLFALSFIVGGGSSSRDEEWNEHLRRKYNERRNHS